MRWSISGFSDRMLTPLAIATVGVCTAGFGGEPDIDDEPLPQPPVVDAKGSSRDQIMETMVGTPRQATRTLFGQAIFAKAFGDIVGADASVARHHFGDGAVEGYTGAVTLAGTLTHTPEVSIALPFSVTRFEGDHHEMTNTGLDLRLKQPIRGGFGVGGHLFGMQAYQSGVENEAVSGYGGGPFLAYAVDFTSRVTLSLGQLVDIVDTESTRPASNSASGVSLSVQLLERVTVSLQGIYYWNIHSEDMDEIDRGFADIGLEGRVDLGKTWFLTAGVKQAVDYRDVEYTEAHVGVNRLF